MSAAVRKHVAWILVAILNGDWTGDIIYYFEKHDCVSTHDDTVTLLLFFLDDRKWDEWFDMLDGMKILQSKVSE